MGTKYGKLDKDHPRYAQWHGWVDRVNEEMDRGVEHSRLFEGDQADLHKAIFFTAFSAGAGLGFELVGEKEFADRLRYAAGRSLLKAVAKKHGKSEEEVLATAEVLQEIDEVIERLEEKIGNTALVDEPPKTEQAPLFDRGA